MLQAADQALTSLAECLHVTERGSSGSRFGISAQKLGWHWKREDVQKHIQRIEMIKVWFILLLTTDLQ